MTEDMKYDTQEYYEKCYDIRKYGGELWLIERDDTHKYLCHNLTMWNSNKPYSKWKWSNNIMALGLVSFLSKEDAERYIKNERVPKGDACMCCGHIKERFNLIINGHEFVPQNKP